MKTTLFKRCCHLFAAGVLILFATAMPGWAQTQTPTVATATLTGAVVDPIGSVVPGAVVTARNEATGVSNRATADAQAASPSPACP